MIYRISLNGTSPCCRRGCIEHEKTKGVGSGLTQIRSQGFRLTVRSSAAAEKSGEGMACKIRLERNHFLMLWIFNHSFRDVSGKNEDFDLKS
jgi:hypothetical protein